MSKSYLRIYLILVLYIMTKVKYGILQLAGTTEAFPSQKNGTTTEAFHLQHNGTAETFPSPLNGKTEAPPQNGTTTEAFHLQHNGTAETFPSPLDATTEALPSRDGTPGMAEPLDTTRGVTVWWRDKNHVPNKNCPFQFCSCEDFEKLGTVECYEDFFPLFTKSQRIHIKFLRIDDPQVALDEQCLEGVLLLDEFDARRSGLKTIPDFSFVKDSIRIIKIESSRLSSLEGTHLQNLRSVTHLSFSHNAIRHIHPGVFQGTENIVHLDLSYNLLTSIPRHLLDRIRRLDTFSASHNHLLNVKFVFDAIIPKVILLDFNKLTNAHEVLMVTLPNYVKLSDSKKKIEWTGLQRKGPEYYLPFWEVYLLDLSHNHITSEDTVFRPEWYNVKGPPFFRVERILLDGNQLRNLRPILRRYRVVEFRASRNRLEAVYGEDFSMVHDTVNLSLRDNEIRRIDLDAFQPIRSTLQRLDLSCNWIPHLNGSVRYLSELKKLNVSYNDIQSFSEDEFTGLHSLSELYLQHNRISVLAQLQHLIRLGQLDISHNHIQLIRPQQLSSSLRAGTAISLGDWARGKDKEKDFATISPELCLRSDLGNRTWDSEQCPDLCTCSCRDDFMFVDCSFKSLFAVPQFLREVEGNKTVDSDLVMRQNRDPLRHFEDRVRGINLEYNNLESLEGAHLPPNLTLLYLAHNKLRRLPETLLDYLLGLEQMSLAGNPWTCDCSAVTFKKWLISNKKIFRDLDAIRCGPDEKESVAGRAMWQLTDFDLCPSTPIRLIVSVAFGILTFIIVCLSAKLLFARYELNIRVFLYNHGLTFAREEDIDQDKVFDVFVSFSHADDEFVIRDIIPVIEKKDPEIRLCLHYRHFMAGEFILDNITRAVHSSKRTLLILTRNFLKSEWCLQEFRTAHRQSMVDKVHRIVAVKVGDLPKKIDPTLQVYLDCTTYLVWGEVDFWNKLLFVLPTRNTGKNKTVVEDYPDL